MKRSVAVISLLLAVSTVLLGTTPVHSERGSGANGTGSVAIVHLYLDVSCPACEKLAGETIPDIAAAAGFTVSILKHDVLNPAAMAELVELLGARGARLDSLPVAIVFIGDRFDSAATPTRSEGAIPADALILQGFDDIERGVSLLFDSRLEAEPEPENRSTGVAAAEEGDSPIASVTTAFSVGAIVGAGLLDGINPCAFSTMLFLISMLALVGRSRRDIVFIGIIYSATIFVGYFAAGLGLFASVRAFMVFPLIVRGLRWLLVAVLTILAVVSARDAWLARAGRSREMVLQLSETMKRRVHAVVRTGTRKASLVGGTIVLGLGVTVFEFSCTGQVYLPVIMYLARSGTPGSIGLLFAYNVAFMIPLLVVFVLAYAGVSMKRLGGLFQRHLALVKLGFAALFAGLAVLTIVT